MKENIERMKQLRTYGLSYQAIGEIFGVSRQRIHQLIPETRRGKLNIKALALLID